MRLIKADILRNKGFAVNKYTHVMYKAYTLDNDYDNSIIVYVPKKYSLVGFNYFDGITRAVMNYMNCMKGFRL